MSFGIPVRNGLAIGLLASTTLSSRRGLSPALFLDFLQPYLDSRITFSRGTNATLVDSTGKITYAPANFLLRSEEFDNIAWTKTSGGLGVVPVVTANADVAPDGTTTADRIQFSVPGNTNSSADFSVAVQIPAGSGPALCGSVWMRSNTGTNQTVFIRAGDTFLSLTVTPTWQRYSVTQSTASTAFTFNIGIRGSVTPNVTSADVLVWGAQLEPVTYQTTPGPYVATTASAYYGPRFDYDPVTLAPRGLLIEEARTNLLTYSEQFDNAAWTKTAATVTANATASPDGTTNADALIENTATSVHEINFGSISVTTGTAYTATIYVKANGRTRLRVQMTASIFPATALAFFDTSTGAADNVGVGATASMVNVGNGWYRCVITATASATASAPPFYLSLVSTGIITSYTGNGTSGVYLYGAQLEAGTFATSYIPTVASTVSRSADVATMTGTNFSSWYSATAGTFVAAFSTIWTGAAAASYGVLGMDSSNTKRVIQMQAGLTQPSVRDAVTTLFTANSISAGPNTVASAYNSTTKAIVLAGGTVASDAVDAAYSASTSLNIGAFGTNSLNGHIRAIAYYNTRLPNTQLQTLTAPSLASPLALDFISPTYTVGY
jgi:hypothetical protein